RLLISHGTMQAKGGRRGGFRQAGWISLKLRPAAHYLYSLIPRNLLGALLTRNETRLTRTVCVGSNRPSDMRRAMQVFVSRRCIVYRSHNVRDSVRCTLPNGSAYV